MGKIVYARATTSTFLFISFFVVFFTGVGLYISPSGRLARETSWSFFGLTRDALTLIHIHRLYNECSDIHPHCLKFWNVCK
ncbi:hypothetical protein AciM339_0857 [Aciduliprofundum sp. MAR08-339]|uniref:DUF4405 domain-containing protein n=1 Tax=Aciduliprofundum sp. (strain MAR08-339) TaxID=673860 RepID=UPI0002A47A09|nr:hypothetical protein AciM339_0857 [Aciduliprofundum sp. MAR08-339]